MRAASTCARVSSLYTRVLSDAVPNRSPNNPGAKQMMEELEAAAGGRRARRLPRRLSPQAPLTMDLKWTTDERQMEAAEHFLLYLNDRTWEPGQLKRQLTRS